MKIRKVILCVAMVSLSLLMVNPTTANTLSDAYSTVFTYPYSFDGYIDLQSMLNEDYGSDLASCVEIAIPVIQRMEQQLNLEYSGCPDNPTCTEIAKNMQIVSELRTNVINLDDYVQVGLSDQQQSFPDSEIGKAALIVKRLHDRLGIPVSQNEVLQLQLAVLSNISCY
jgi:hypothetical protein